MKLEFNITCVIISIKLKEVIVMSVKYDAINLPLVYVNEKWLNGESGVSNILMMNCALENRTRLINWIKSQGFKITHDVNNLPDDTIYITEDWDFCDNLELDNPVKKLKRHEEEKEKINLACGQLLLRPKTYTFESFCQMNETFRETLYPVVFKNELVDTCMDKYRLDTPEQFEMIRQFYYSVAQKNSLEYIFKGCTIQQFIESPTERYSYIRILMCASGDIMVPVLKYSDSVVSPRTHRGHLDKYFLDKCSEYFLNSQPLFNYTSTGGLIFLDKPCYDPLERRILTAHQIDPDNPKVPGEILTTSPIIARTLNKILISAHEYMYNDRDGKWYFLEQNTNPALMEYANAVGMPLSTEADNINLDCGARSDAFEMVLMSKNKQFAQRESSNTQKLGSGLELDYTLRLIKENGELGSGFGPKLVRFIR